MNAQCSICQQSIPSKGTETWISEGVPIDLDVDDFVWVLISRGEEEIVICEQCFENGNLKGFSGEEIAEIGDQFGLEYLHNGQFSKAIEACSKTLKQFKGLNLLNTVAGSLVRPENISDAIILYRAVLVIEPDNALAKANLDNLMSRYEGPKRI